MADVKPIPDGYHSVTPYLIVKGATRAIEFYKQAFGATEIMRFEMGDKLGHAEIQIGNSRVMLSDEYAEMGYLGPDPSRGSPVSLSLYVEDVDSMFKQAEAAGAQVVRPVQDQFYGDRQGVLKDPFGHVWNLATHKEDLSFEEMHRRAAAAYS